MFFKDIVGQEEIKKHLRSEVRAGKVAHAQLFCGPEGSGKLPLAIAYARYLSCTNRGEEDSCGVCPSCVKFNKLIHPDTHFVFPVIKSLVSDDYITPWRDLVLSSPYFALNHWMDAMKADNQHPQISVKDIALIHRPLSLISTSGGL